MNKSVVHYTTHNMDTASVHSEQVTYEIYKQCVLLLGHRLPRWPNNKKTVFQWLVFARKVESHRVENIDLQSPRSHMYQRCTHISTVKWSPRCHICTKGVHIDSQWSCSHVYTAMYSGVVATKSDVREVYTYIYSGAVATKSHAQKVYT